MKGQIRFQELLFSLLFVLSLGFQGCNHYEKKSKPQPAKIENRQGDKIPYVILTSEADRRIGIVTVPFEQNGTIEGKRSFRIPVSTIVYDVEGKTWIYIQVSSETESNTYHRKQVELLKIHGNFAFISGPFEKSELERPIVSVGAAELLGTESGVGK